MVYRYQNKFETSTCAFYQLNKSRGNCHAFVNRLVLDCAFSMVLKLEISS